MAENRVTTGALEVLHEGASTVRVTSTALEVLHEGVATVRVTSAALEVLRSVSDAALEEFISVTFDLGFDFAGIASIPEVFLSAAFDLGFDLEALPISGFSVNIPVAMNFGFDLAAIPSAAVTNISAAMSFGFDAAVVMDVPNFYSNGPREAFITVTTDLDTFSGTPSNLVDGAFNNDASDALGIGLNDLEIAPGDFFVQFALAEQKIFTGIKVIQSQSYNGGEWQWQGSDDGSGWTDISTPFFISGAGGVVQSFSLPNATPYFFYRMLSVDGIINQFGYWLEFEFIVVGETILQLISASFDLGLALDPQQFVEPPSDVQVLIIASGR